MTENTQDCLDKLKELLSSFKKTSFIAKVILIAIILWQCIFEITVEFKVLRPVIDYANSLTERQIDNMYYKSLNVLSMSEVNQENCLLYEESRIDSYSKELLSIGNYVMFGFSLFLTIIEIIKVITSHPLIKSLLVNQLILLSSLCKSFLECQAVFASLIDTEGICMQRNYFDLKEQIGLLGFVVTFLVGVVYSIIFIISEALGLVRSFCQENPIPEAKKYKKAHIFFRSIIIIAVMVFIFLFVGEEDSDIPYWIYFQIAALALKIIIQLYKDIKILFSGEDQEKEAVQNKEHQYELKPSTDAVTDAK